MCIGTKNVYLAKWNTKISYNDILSQLFLVKFEIQKEISWATTVGYILPFMPEKEIKEIKCKQTDFHTATRYRNICLLFNRVYLNYNAICSA